MSLLVFIAFGSSTFEISLSFSLLLFKLCLFLMLCRQCFATLDTIVRGFFFPVCLVRGEFLGFRVYIIIDNGKPFLNRLMDKLCEDFGFKKHNPSMYNAPTNGLVEAFNKTLRNLFKKVVGRSKKDWHERINETLWAY